MDNIGLKVENIVANGEIALRVKDYDLLSGFRITGPVVLVYNLKKIEIGIKHQINVVL